MKKEENEKKHFNWNVKFSILSFLPKRKRKPKKLMYRKRMQKAFSQVIGIKITIETNKVGILCISEAVI